LAKTQDRTGASGVAKSTSAKGHAHDFVDCMKVQAGLSTGVRVIFEDEDADHATAVIMFTSGPWLQYGLPTPSFCWG